MQKSENPGSILNMKWSGPCLWRGEITVFMRTPNIRWAVFLIFLTLCATNVKSISVMWSLFSLFLECSLLLFLCRNCTHVSQSNLNAGPSTKPSLSDTSFPDARKSKSFPSGGFYYALLGTSRFQLKLPDLYAHVNSWGHPAWGRRLVCQGQGHKHVTLRNPEIKWALCWSLWN